MTIHAANPTAPAPGRLDSRRRRCRPAASEEVHRGKRSIGFIRDGISKQPPRASRECFRWPIGTRAKRRASPRRNPPAARTNRRALPLRRQRDGGNVGQDLNRSIPGTRTSRLASLLTTSTHRAAWFLWESRRFRRGSCRIAFRANRARPFRWRCGHSARCGNSCR